MDYQNIKYKEGKKIMANYYMVRIMQNVEHYVKKSVVAVGWSEINFSIYTDADKLCKDVKDYYYNNSTDMRLPGRKLGEVKRFYSIQKDDVLLIPCYKGFYIATSKGEFIYDTTSEDLMNQLRVTYVTDLNGAPIIFDRNDKNTALSTKLKVRGYTVLNIYEKEIINTVDKLISEKEDLPYLSKIISEENKRLLEFKTSLTTILPDYKKIGLQAGGIGFEKMIKYLFEADGYSVKRLSKQCGGSDVADADILAVKKSKIGDEFSSVLYMQVKHYSGKSDNGIDQIIAFKEKIAAESTDKNAKVITDEGEWSVNVSDIKYVLISTGTFTDYVIDKAEENDITLIDIDRLAEMLYEVMDDFPEIIHSLGYVKTYQHVDG